MIMTSGSLASSDNVVLSFTLGISLTICFAHICFSLTSVGVGIWYLVGGVALQVHFLILILSSKIINFDIGASLSESDSWILSNVGFCSKSGKEEYVFAVMFSKICKFLTLVTPYFILQCRLYK